MKSDEKRSAREDGSPDIGIGILLQLSQSWQDSSLDQILTLRRSRQDSRKCFETLCDVESDVGDGVVSKGKGGVEDCISDDLNIEGRCHGLRFSKQ